jgi:PRC-barrel domain protein
VTLERLAVKLVHAALLAAGITTVHPASAEIDASQADARLIGMPIYTADGLLIGQVTNVETYGTNRAIVAAIGGFLAFGPRIVWIPLTWANKEDDYIRLLLTNNQLAGFGQGIGSR